MTTTPMLTLASAQQVYLAAERGQRIRASPLTVVRQKLMERAVNT